MILGSGLIQSTWPRASDWLVRDEFTDTLAAGSVNGTAATPGPGTRTVTDTGNLLSVGSGMASWSGNTATGNPGIWYGAQTRLSGMCALFSLSISAVTAEVRIGWDFDQNSHVTDSYLRFVSAGRVFGVNNYQVADYSLGTSYQFAIVARSTGALFFMKIDSVWTLIDVSLSGITANIYPGLNTNTGAVGALDYLRVIALPSPFNGDDGITTDVLSGSVSAGTTFTHEADCLIEWTQTTLPSSGATVVYFRQVDSQNWWRVAIYSTGVMALDESVDNVATNRGTAAGAVANGNRIVIIVDGTTIKGYSNDVLRWSYASATNFATSTAGRLVQLGTGGAVSDLKTWPRTLSGLAADLLDEVSA